MRSSTPSEGLPSTTGNTSIQSPRPMVTILGRVPYLGRAVALWFLGHADLARQRAREAVALAEDPRRRHGYATALAHAAMVEQCRLDVAATARAAAVAIEAATESGYVYRFAMGTILNGWALAAEGSYEQGIAELEQGLELARKTGARMDDPYFLALLADACVRAGQFDRASAAAGTGLAHMARGRRFFFECELHRLAGKLLLRLERRDEERRAYAKRSGWRAPSGCFPRATRSAEPCRPPPRRRRHERGRGADRGRLFHVHPKDSRPTTSSRRELLGLQDGRAELKPQSDRR